MKTFLKVLFKVYGLREMMLRSEVSNENENEKRNDVKKWSIEWKRYEKYCLKYMV